MTSLAEVYEENVGEVKSLRRLYLGTGLFLAGVVLAVIAIVVATTDVFAGFGQDRFRAWRLAGVLGGLGVPALMMGVFTVLPTSKRIKAAAAIGASISILGVGLFWYAYPTHWAGYGRNLTLHVTGVYFFGMATATWCLFTAVVNFKTRNDPGGTVTMEVTRKGETRVVEVPRSELQSGGLGGVGLFGGTPDGDVETQTNQPDEDDRDTGSRSANSTARSANATSRSADTASGGRTGSRSGTTATGSTGRNDPANGSRSGGLNGGPQVSDGGATETDLSSPMDDSATDDAEVMESTSGPRQPTDRYCGNCDSFRYVRTENGMRPYCGLHEEAMDDMDACEQWSPNS